MPMVWLCVFPNALFGIYRMCPSLQHPKILPVKEKEIVQLELRSAGLNIIFLYFNQ